MRWVGHTSGWACILALLACGGGSSDGSEPPGEGEGEGEGEGSGGGEGDLCAAAVDCARPLRCDPASLTCTGEEQGCALDEECGLGSACGQEGQCVRIDSGVPCTSNEECPGGECLGGLCGCGGEQYAATGVPANVLIAIDRSNSMQDPPGRGGGESKWEIARRAVASLLATYGDRIRFGLMLWPGLDEECRAGEDCGVGHVFVDVGDGTAGAINDVLSRADTCHFGTPIGANVGLVRGEGGLQDPARANYLLLVSDGEETCEGDSVAEVTALRNQLPEVRTFVVGFGGEVDPELLAALAEAGGTARAGDPAYFQADDAAGLEDAFLTIGANVLSCDYVLAEQPPDARSLAVYLDRIAAPHDADHVDGWDYDEASGELTFFGATCDSLREGTVDELLIVYGCPAGPGEVDGEEPGLCPIGVVPCSSEEQCEAGTDCSDGCCVLQSPF